MRQPIELPIILVVCDNKAVLSFIKKHIKEHYYLLLAKSDREALEILETNHVSLMIIDEDLHDLAPLEFSTKLRKISSYKQIPLVLITSHLKKAYTEKALDAGYTDFLNKPLDKQELEQRIQVGLALSRTKEKLSVLRPSEFPILPQKSRTYSYGAYLNALSKAKRVGLPACLLLIEEDQYNKILDKKGKPYALKLLKQIKSSIEHYLRSSDLLFAQMDGTFLLVLPKTTQAAGKAFAEMLRHEIGETLFCFEGDKVAITLSIGIVHYEDKAHPMISGNYLFERLFESARKALEFARKRGNRTAFLSPEKEDHYEIIV